jgi:L-threonylcarbamoyladenylate synthase
MKRIPITAEQPHPDAIKQAVDVMRRGGVIIYPTDTCYGIGVDARNHSAVRRLIMLKLRHMTEKPFSVIVQSIDAIRPIAQLDGDTEGLLHEYLPGPYTFVLVNLDFRISRSSSIGIRIPASVTTSMLAATFHGPFTTTSANVSGLASPYSFEGIEQSLLNPITQSGSALPDLILDAGRLAPRAPSTVIDLTTAEPRIIRQGSGLFPKSSRQIAWRRRVTH